MRTLFCILFFLVGSFLFAQNTSKFAVEFGDNGQDEGRRIIQTYDNGYAIIGSTGSTITNSSDIYVIKLDSAGYKTWEKYIGRNGVDNGYGIIQLVDSSYILVGNTFDVVNGYDYFMVRINTSGDTIWTKNTGTTGWDFLYDVTSINDSTFVAVGTSESPDTSGQEASFVKFDWHGNILQQKSFGGGYNDVFKSVILDHQANLVAVGSTESFGNGNKDVLLMKVTENLDSVFLRTYGGSQDDVAEKIIETKDSLKYFILGSTKSFGGGLNDFYTIVCDINGDTIYTFTLGSYDNEMGYGICQDYENHVAFAGLTEGPSYHKILIRKNDVFGNFLFQTQVSGFSSINAGNYYSDAFDLKTTRDSGYVLVGKNQSTFTGQQNVYVVKFDKQFQTATSVRQIPKMDMAFNFENPACNTLIFLSVLPPHSQIRITNQIGQIVYSESVLEKTYELDISSLQSGMYVVQLISEDGNHISSKKLVKYASE